MKKPLVVVESPAKAKTIAQFLGNRFTVMASVGHVVELPSNKLGVDTENDFALTYAVARKDVLKSLKDALKGASALYLATDDDREGEAIAWHLCEQLKPKVPVSRMVFHEITKSAIMQAVEQGREINRSLVEAQETRRTLDRLFGFEVSQILWRKVKSGLSAGRVQSPTLRLIVARERERMRFRAASHWDLTATHATLPVFSSRLLEINGTRIVGGKDFDATGQLTGNSLLLDEAGANALQSRLSGLSFTVRSVEERPTRISPKAPFVTSTLQQEGARKLGLTAQQIMRVAQKLYENGYITYMRTDSTSLSDTALRAARTQIFALFGPDFLTAEPRLYLRKSKNSQEAHEAIRPAGECFRAPVEVAKELTAVELKLYELIWKRTLASQMADAVGVSVSARLAARTTQEEVVFAASGRTLTFKGFLRAYVEDNDDAESDLEDREVALPPLIVGASIAAASIESNGHVTSPPARFTEASLVKKLEELGIGRPSTYASIMGTLQAKYVWKKGQALVPGWTAFVVVDLLERHFGDLVDYGFTAKMELDLDDIAGGRQGRVPYLQEFYWGPANEQRPGLKRLLADNIAGIDPALINSVVIGKDAAGSDVVLRLGRYGPYLKRSDDTVSVSESLAPDEVTLAKALELLSAPRGNVPIGVDPETGLFVFVKQGQFGPYVQLGEMPKTAPEKKGSKGKRKKKMSPVEVLAKPKTASLFKNMKAETLTLAEALELLRLPRILGTSDGENVIAANGRYGPYVKRAKEARDLGADHEMKLFTVTLEEAVALLAIPKPARARGQAKPALRTFSADPISGNPVMMKAGRFGVYVTDGETSATLKRGEEAAEITPERAFELLELRRDYVARNPKKSVPNRRDRSARPSAPR
jgi:DNA topoisomerase-1